MAQVYFYPAPSVNATNPSVSTNGTPIPGSSTLIGAETPGGNLSPLQLDASGNLKVDISAPASPLQVDLTKVGGVAVALGQAAMAASFPVVIASNQSAVPISAASLPLPTNAAQEAGGHLASLDTKMPSQGQALMVASTPVVIASDQSAVPVSGSVTVSGTVSATQGTTPWSDNISQFGGSAVSLGSHTSANSMPVVIASDQGAVPVSGSVKQAGKAKANPPTFNDYTGTPVTSAAYVQVIASTASDASTVEIFDSSGQALYFAVGAPAAEVDQFIIYPGGNGQVPLSIPSGSRVSLKAVSTSATVGFIVINLYG